MKATRRTFTGGTNERGGPIRAAVLLALAVAFLLQTLSWAARLPMAAAGERIEICVADGVAVMTVDADGRPIDESERTRGEHGCPLCPLIGGLFVAPTFAGVAVPVAFRPAEPTPTPRRAAVPARIPSDIWARGPPGRAAL